MVQETPFSRILTRRWRLLSAAAALLLAVSAGAPALGAPADPAATSGAITELAYFQGLSARSDKKVLSGQFIGWIGGIDDQLFPRISQVSGKYPAIMSANYADFGAGISDFSEPNSFLVAHWNQGGLVEVAIHANNVARRRPFRARR